MLMTSYMAEIRSNLQTLAETHHSAERFEVTFVLLYCYHSQGRVCVQNGLIASGMYVISE
jgi:hypothetical protein